MYIYFLGCNKHKNNHFEKEVQIHWKARYLGIYIFSPIHCEWNYSYQALKSHSKEKLEAKKPYDFDRNKKEVRYQKKNSGTPQIKKPQKFKPMKYIWLLGQ